MTAPSPAIPTFANTVTLQSSALSAMGQHLANLYDLSQGGFRDTKPITIVGRQLLPMATLYNATDILVFWDVAFANTDNMWAADWAQLLTVWTPGWYRLDLQVHCDGLPNGTRQCKILVNGTNPSTNVVAVDERNPMTAGEGTVLRCSAYVALAVGATVSADVYMNTDQYVSITTAFSGSFLSAEWVAPL